MEKEHALYDQLVLGHIERFYDEGPCYAWFGSTRLGPFETDTAARKAVENAALLALGPSVAKEEK